MRRWARPWGAWSRGGSPPARRQRPAWFLMMLAQEDRYITLTQPMREAVQGHVRLLVPFLEPEAAREMSVWYGKAYPRRRRLPVQSQLFQELERRARRR